ncbi:MAG TPA: hypothetical protein VNT27_03050 [Propionibacteriaceae bacterium]|nr:hypothetical protein [Propionibacteriaceae bacterium]
MRRRVRPATEGTHPDHRRENVLYDLNAALRPGDDTTVTGAPASPSSKAVGSYQGQWHVTTTLCADGCAEELCGAGLISPPILDASTIGEAAVTGQRYARLELWAELLSQL